MNHELADPLATAGAAVISDCLNRFGVMDAGMQRLSGTGVSGPAFPVRTMVGDNSTLHRAVAGAPPGSVLVVDAGSFTDRAVWGELLTLAAIQHRVLGAVIDGAVRDIDAIRRSGFPIFARGHTPAGPHKGWHGDQNVTISCGGVPVSPGDLVVGDADGVVVVPHDRLPAVRAAVSDRLQVEAEWRRRIGAGEATTAILGIETGHGEV
jgi:4-hydroxy-4-methyl-2-oxoglutarate aldolase